MTICSSKKPIGSSTTTSSLCPFCGKESLEKRSEKVSEVLEGEIFEVTGGFLQCSECGESLLIESAWSWTVAKKAFFAKYGRAPLVNGKPAQLDVS